MTGQVFYVGRNGNFSSADMNALQKPDLAELARTDCEMETLRFRVVGDFSLDAFPNAVMREYVNPASTAVAIHVQGDEIEPYTEFYTTFADGSSLTTTGGSLGGSHPEAKIFRVTMRGKSPSDLLAAHLRSTPKHEEAFRTRALKPGPSLEWLAEAIDNFMTRSTSQESERTMQPAIKWNSTGELLTWAAREFGQEKFLAFESTAISFDEADKLASRIANAFGSLGLTKGDRVAVMLSNGLLFPVIWLAIGRAGLVMTPVNTEYKSHDLEYILNDSGASCLVTQTDFLAEYEEIASKCPRVKDVVCVGGGGGGNGALEWDQFVDGASEQFAGPAVGSHDLVNIQYTSGTTGFPKGCMLSHRYWLLMGHFACDGLETRPGDVHLNVQPFYYMDGQWNVVLSLMSGTPLVLTSRFSASTFWRTVNDFGVTYFYCIGTMPVMLLNRAPSALERSHKVRAVSCSGIPKDQHAQIEQRFNCPWREGYGSTESGTDLLVRFEDTACVGTGTLGKPVHTKEMKIIDREGREVPVGEPGELIIKGEPMMLGYWNKPEETAETIVDGWYHTGDLFTKDVAGNYFIVGRVKDMVRRAGENVSAAEVESVLVESPEVQLAAVVSVPDPIRGEEVKAFIVPTNFASADKETAARILEFARKKLAAFKVPRFVEFKESFPMTASERVEKHKLREARANPREYAYDDTIKDWWRPN